MGIGENKMMTHDTLATTTTTHCGQQGTPPPLANPARPDELTPQIYLHLAQYINPLKHYPLNSNTCLRHPKLTMKLRSLPDFPLFKRAYTVEPPHRVTDPAYYDRRVRDCSWCFTEDLTTIHEQLKGWISTFGHQEEIPLIDSFEVNPQGCMEYCVINGLRWDFASKPKHAGQWAKYLDLHELFSIDPQKQIRIEDAIPGSPLISLYIQDNSNPEGHNDQLFWYNLDTRGRGEMTDAVRY
jgi:hypothetical protein